MSNQLIINIGARKIGSEHPTFIIVELSGNHHQKFEEAEALVRAAVCAGAAPRRRPEGSGSYYRVTDRARINHLLTAEWDTPIKQLIEKI